MLKQTIEWVKHDFNTNAVRFVVELCAWLLGVGCSIVMAFTVPSPPLAYIYPVWITGCCMLCWAAYTRGSSGLVLNYCFLATVDIIGAIRIWL